MKEKLKQLWEFFSGKKTVIGMSIIAVNAIVKFFFPNALPDDIHEVIRWVGEGIGGFGLLHKAEKTKTVRRWENELKTKVKKK